jgi:glycosyltransferase involved in cell wall biosynthesis
MNQPIRVGILGIKGLPAQAGVDRVVESVAKRLPALGIAPTIFCDHSYTADNYTAAGIKIVRIGSLRGKYVNAPSRFLNSAVKATFSEKLDIIHLHNIEAGFILPLLRLKYPVLSTAHGFAYWRSKWGGLARRMIKLADRPFVNLSSLVTSVSEKDAQALREKYHKKVEYIPNGVDREFQPDVEKAYSLLSGLGLSAHEFLIFVAGRIEPTKGAHLVMDAVNRLGRKVPLLVVGDLEQVPAYARKLRGIAGDKVFFLPPIKETELLFGLMVCSRCLVFPSTVEAMSMVLLEAASLGVPVLASDIQENQMALGDYIEYFESESIDSLLDRLQWVLDNPAYMAERSKKCQQFVHLQYDWDIIAAKYADLYKYLMNKEQPII